MLPKCWGQWTWPVNIIKGKYISVSFSAMGTEYVILFVKINLIIVMEMKCFRTRSPIVSVFYVVNFCQR